MKKSMVDLVGFLLVAVFVSCPLISVAQETTSVPFTAVEEEKEVKAEIKSSCADRRLYFGGEYIYSDVKMDAADDYIAWINATYAGNIEDFDYALGFSVYLDYFFTENIGIELGYERIDTDVSGTYYILLTPYSFGIDTSVNGGTASLVLQKSLGQDNFTVGARIGAGYYKADYEEYDAGVLFQEDDDAAIGYKVSVYSNYCLTKNLSIYLSGGYRFLEFDDFDIAFVTGPAVELDFSGFFGAIGLTLGW